MNDLWPLVMGGDPAPAGDAVEDPLRWDVWVKVLEPWLWKCLVQVIV